MIYFHMGQMADRAVKVKTETLIIGNKGFTLIELVIVLTIAASLIAIVPPALNRLLPAAQLKASARAIVASLRSARNLAFSHKKESVFLIDLNRYLFYIDSQKRIDHLPSHLKIELFTAESEMIGKKVGGIRFFPQGGSTGGRIRLSTEKRGYMINIDWLTGRIQLSQDETIE